MPAVARVLVADGQSIYRAGLRAVLGHEGFTVIGEAATGPHIVEMTSELKPDMVLMDLALPGLPGVEVVRRILSERPSPRLVALTAEADGKSVLECLAAGVHGCLMKDVDAPLLIRHLRAVLRSESVVDPKVAGVLMKRLRSGQREEGPPLTAQQLSILRLAAQGLSNREIGERVRLSENTVKGHVAEILGRLAVRNRVEATLLASSRGWL